MRVVVQRVTVSRVMVDQFTLYDDCRMGRRPSLDGAAPPALAEAL